MEALKNNETPNQNENTQDGRVVPFDAKAAVLARKQRVAEIKAEHPNAEFNIDRAHVMAVARNKYEKEAAEHEKKGERVDADFIRHLGRLVEEAAGANYDKRYSSHHRKSNGDTLAS